MSILNQIYRTSLSTLTDFYQLTMAYSAWKTNTLNKEAVFDLYFRSQPFGNGFAIACGLESVLDFVDQFHFDPEDLEYIASLRNPGGGALFEKEFIDYLRDMKLTVDIDAIEEGRVVFANEPLLRVRGNLSQCQLLESPLLNLVNFQTLIATKAARIRQVVGTDKILEFGMRRAQGIDGAISASRAAYIGGADATSNLLAGKLFDIPVQGTHAHSWVMAFHSEKEAFSSFAAAMPGNCTFLVDTYNTIEGIKNAISVGLKLKEQGQTFSGVRLDSGDLAYLSLEARRLLDEAGFQDTKIVASSDLDETIISSLKLQGAKIDIWGVGTRLVTAFEQPALGGVYKLVAVRENTDPQNWTYKMKLSEQVSKSTTPGIHQVRRFVQKGRYCGDMIFDLQNPPNQKSPFVIVDPLDFTRRKTFSPKTSHEDLLKPAVRNGKSVSDRPSLKEIKGKAVSEIEKLHPSIRRILNPHNYPVGLELGLHEMKSRMILDLRGFSTESTTP